MNFSGKRVLVCGIARSGISACALLRRRGAEVTASDLKEREKMEADCDYLESLGVTLYLGRNPDDAFVEGFELVVLSPGIPIDLPFIEKARRAGIPVWGEIELAYRLCLAPVIAVTGTNGKTTTTTLTGEIIRAHYPGSAVLGNIGIPFCDGVEALTKDDFAVVEISSFQMESSLLFRPKISAIINITPDHINRHKTLENYIAHKERIFANQRETDFLVLNFDDELCRGMWEKTAAQVMFFSRRFELPDGIFMKDGDMLLKWRGVYEKIIARSELQSPFDHILEDAMAAAGMAVCAGVPLEKIRGVLRDFKGLPHRVEHCGEARGVDFCNDSKATNVDAAVKALESIHKPVLLIAGGQDKHVEFSDWVKLFAGKVRFAALIGETADQIAECCKAHGFFDFEKTNSLKSATELCFSRAGEGDCVLLSPACASLDMFDSYEQRGALFRSFAEQLINETRV